MIEHRGRKAIYAVIIAAAGLVGAHYGEVAYHRSLTANTVCVVAPSSSTHRLTTTPRTDGYYAGLGSDGRYHAVEFMPDDRVRYAHGIAGDTAVSMPARLADDPPVNYDQNGNFRLAGYNENFVITNVTDDSLVLTVTTTVGCLDNKVRAVSATLHFASTPVQNA